MNKRFLIFVLASISIVALGQSTLKDTKTQIAASADVIPVGTVMPYVGSSAPTGWLLAQGQCVSQATYAALYTVTSALPYQTGCAGGQFRLPPLNGRYLRGAGAPTDGQGGDTVALGTFGANKTKKNGLVVSGGTAALANVSGSIVSGGTATLPTSSHTHNQGSGTSALAARITMSSTVIHMRYIAVSPTWSKNWSASLSSSSDSGSGVGDAAEVVGTTGSASATGQINVSNTAAAINDGDTETRPHSYAVNYIIKY